jgi:hypothetical protein
MSSSRLPRTSVTVPALWPSELSTGVFGGIAFQLIGRSSGNVYLSRAGRSPVEARVEGFSTRWLD